MTEGSERFPLLSLRAWPIPVTPVVDTSHSGPQQPKVTWKGTFSIWT